MTVKISKPFTGYHMAAILISFFGIVISVNIYMAKVAIGTFGGTVVDNSYVASQQYNEWLAEGDRQAKLGWNVQISRVADGRVGLSISGQDGGSAGSMVSAIAQHPLGRAPERTLLFIDQGNGRQVSREALPGGRWLLRIEVARAGEHYRTVADIQ